MASPWRWSAYAGIQTLLSTELNSLASVGRVASGAIDNSSDLLPFMDWEVVWKVGSADTLVEQNAPKLFLLPSIDGTNYADFPASNSQFFTNQLGFCANNGTTNTQRSVIRHTFATPGKFKVLFVNWVSFALAASGNTLKYNMYTRERGAGDSTLKWSSYGGVQTVFTTELDSLGNNKVTSGAIDNSSGYQFADFELYCQLATGTVQRASGTTLSIFPSIDGTNYAVKNVPTFVGFYEDWLFNTTAHRLILVQVPLPPGQFKVELRAGHHTTGAATSAYVASGNTLKYNPYNLQVV